MDINIDMSIDEDEFKQAIAEQMEEVVKEYLETKAQKGHFECPNCGNNVFDIMENISNYRYTGASIQRITGRDN